MGSEATPSPFAPPTVPWPNTDTSGSFGCGKNCKTAPRVRTRGCHIYKCDNLECGREEQSYNSCRNRNCPKCQYSAKELWVEQRVMELLPIPYFHMVFTLPHSLNELLMYNKVKL